MELEQAGVTVGGIRDQLDLGGPQILRQVPGELF